MEKIIGIYRYDDTYCYVIEDMSSGEYKYKFTNEKDEIIDIIYQYAKENNYSNKTLSNMATDNPLAFNLNCKNADEVFSKIKMYNYLHDDEKKAFNQERELYDKVKENDDFELNPDDAEDLDDEKLIVDYKNGKFGYKNEAGELVIPYEFDYAANFNDGLARVRKGKYYGFVNNFGTEIIPFIYDEAFDFHDGLALVVKDGKYGFIDETGKAVIPLIYDFAQEFKDGKALVVKDGKTSYIDKSGKETSPPSLDDDFELDPADAEDLDDDEIDEDSFLAKHPRIAAIIDKLPLPGTKNFKVAVACVTAIAVGIAGGVGLSKLVNRSGSPTANGSVVATTLDDEDLDYDIDDEIDDEIDADEIDEDLDTTEDEKTTTTSATTSASSNQVSTSSGSGGSSYYQGSSGTTSSSSSSSSAGSVDTSLPAFQDPDATLNSSSNSTSSNNSGSSSEDSYENVYEEEEETVISDGNTDDDYDEVIDVPAVRDEDETISEDVSSNTLGEVDEDDVIFDVPSDAVDDDLSYEYDEDYTSSDDNYSEVIETELPDPNDVYEWNSENSGDNVTTEDEYQADVTISQDTNDDATIETVPVEQAVDDVISAMENGEDVTVNSDGTVTYNSTNEEVSSITK